MNSDHIVVSEPGFDASSVSLDDANKVFDSNWGYSACLLFSGTYDITPFPTYDGSEVIKYTINFPFTLNYIPAVAIWSTVTESCPVPNTFNTLRDALDINGNLLYTEVFNDRIETRKGCIQVDLEYKSYAQLFYMVFAV